MHRAYYFLVVLLLVIPAPATAQGDGEQHLELVKGLRDRGHHDLALEYLEKLQGQATLAPETQSALPLELARSRAEVAAQHPSGSDRDRLLQRSRTDLEAYVRSNPPVALAHEAEWALGNVVAEQARSLATAAVRAGSAAADPPTAAKELLNAAVGRFDEADRVYALVQKKLETEQGIKPVPDKAPGKPAAQAPKAPPLYLNVLYHRALARFDKSRVPGLGVRPAALAGDEARQLAETLAAYRVGSPVGWQGYALLARAFEGADDARSATIYRQIEAASVAVAAPAQRQVRYYQLARADASGEVTGPGPARNLLRAQAERWIQLYGAAAGSAPDARHVRYLLIRLLVKELEETPENRRATGDVQARLDRCLALIDGLDNGRAENQEALERLKYGVLKLSGRAGGPVDTLRTFDEALLRTSLEFYQLQGLEEKLKEVGNAPARLDVEAQHRKQNDLTLAAARKTLSLMPAAVPERNRVRVLNMLQSVLRRAHDGPRAALVCELLATTARQPEVAQAAAGEALRLYQYLARSAGKPDPVAAERVLAVAAFLDQRHPDSPQANEARAILGRDLITKRQYDQAVALLTKIPRTEASYATSRYYAGVASWAKHRDVHRDKLKTRSAESNAALGLLNEAVQAFATLKTKGDDEQRQEVQAALLVVGIHDLFGESDQVLQAAGPLLARIEKKQMPAGLPAGTELQVLEAAMNAYLQKKDFQHGSSRLLAVLQQRRGDPLFGDATAFLQSTAVRIRQQLEEYQKQGPAAMAQYQATRESFRQFLEQIEKDPALPPRQRLWLGSSYMTMGEHAKAAAVLAAIQQPPAPAAPGKPGSDEATMIYRQAVTQRVVALRNAAMTEADTNDRDKALAAVEKELQAVAKEDWAKRSPTVMREEILLLEARGHYSGKTGAIARWDAFRNVLRPHVDKNEAMKEMYWEAGFHLAHCVYKEASLLKNPESRKKHVDRAAALINEARRANYGTPTQAARYEALLADPNHKDLKEAADRLSRTAEAAAANSPTKTP